MPPNINRITSFECNNLGCCIHVTVKLIRDDGQIDGMLIPLEGTNEEITGL